MKIKRRKPSITDKLIREIKGVCEYTTSAPVEFLNTGNILLNLALSGKGSTGGFARGRVANIVGDGSSGKTLIALETAANNFYSLIGRKTENFPKVKTVDVYYNNPEAVMDFPLEEMFGSKFVTSVHWKNTRTVEKFGRDFTKVCLNSKRGQAIIYIVDSWDALKSEAEEKAFLKEAKSDKEEKAQMLLKQKYAHEFFRNICSHMEGTDITLIIISQTKQKIDARFGKQQYRTGGKALDFFTHQVVWLYEKGKLKKTRRKRDMIYGINIRARVERNKVAKPFREADFSILFDYGIDNIGAMIDWYYGPQAKIYKFDKKKIKGRENFIKYVELYNKETLLTKQVIDEWNAVEQAIRPQRKRKYP